MSILTLAQRRRRTVPAPRNPMDKCTVVSIYPKEIDEKKPTIQPGRFIIPPGSYESPALLIVGSSSWWREIDEEQPLLEIPNSSMQVATSIVNDFCNGLLSCDMSTLMPGLFWLPGEVSRVKLFNDYKKDLEKAKVKQDAWYRALINLGKSLWAASNGNPLTISDDMRLAAREMGDMNVDWMKEHQVYEQIRCKACGSLKNPEFPVCAQCKAISDPELAKKLGITFAS